MKCPKCKKEIDPTTGELFNGSVPTNVEIQWECAKKDDGCGERLYQFVELDPSQFET